MLLRHLLPPTLLLLIATAGVADAELQPPDRAVAAALDHYGNQALQAAKGAPAPPTADQALARRLYLDLAGRSPTAAEARAFVTSTDSRKREKLIEALLASPGFVRHSAAEFDDLLRNQNPEAPSLRPYLVTAFQQNRPWDRMFRELLGVNADIARPDQFVSKRLKDADALTRDVSSVFFGLNISCAQCHRHPDIKALTQDYYYGMKAFFAASYEFQGNLLEKRHVAPLTFKTKGGQVTNARLVFLNGKTIEPPAAAESDLNLAIQDEARQIAELAKDYAKNKQLPPTAEFSPRRELATLALSPENRELFARAIVNRLWHRFYGRGLVMRVDQMHAQNRASHPELLAWLTRDFIAHGYDLRRLTQGLVGSQAYARSSRWDLPEPPAPELFAVAAIRPLTARQWGMSLRLAADARPDPVDSQAWDKRLLAAEADVQKIFGKVIEPPRDDLQIGIGEALTLSNDAAILKLTGSEIVPTLVKIADRRQLIDQAVWTTLSRPATEQEHAMLGAYLEQRQDRLAAGVQQMVWALFNSPEFRFNH